MRRHMILADDAIRAAEARGMIAKRGASGRRLYVHTGEPKEPGSWMEIAVTLIDLDDCVSRHALRDVLEG